MFFLPGFGVAAYLIFEVLPEWRRAPGVRKTQGQLTRAIDPTRRYRSLVDALDASNTIGNRLALADECLALRRFDEALVLYDGIIASPQGDEPVYYLGKAKAQFALGKAAEALTTLDTLKQHWPAYRSQDGHLLYARALENLGRLDEALGEYAGLSRYYPGPEPRIRQMRLLDQIGRKEEAYQIANDVVANLTRAPAFARKQQAEWFSAAKDYLRRA
ncbi:hypothetical protein [Beijerinckia sp. L45]|uniref:hypothetical protein n=1 Tax=Beijerinckia sp. L45 TaxID=1641855 RepID=UPI00131C0BA6|nr:hypothetical protein [Beijerinckia sp. L45]